MKQVTEFIDICNADDSKRLTVEVLLTVDERTGRSVDQIEVITEFNPEEYRAYMDDVNMVLWERRYYYSDNYYNAKFFVEQYKGYTIQKDQRNPYGPCEFMFYLSEQGIDHDADCTDGESFSYTGNCKWAATLEDAKEEIDCL